VVPPYTESFRLLSGRAIVVDFKTDPFEAGGLIEWRRRLDDLSGGRPLRLGYYADAELEASYGALTAEQFEKLAAKYHASYGVVERARAIRNRFPIPFENGKYVVYDLNAFVATGER